MNVQKVLEILAGHALPNLASHDQAALREALGEKPVDTHVTKSAETGKFVRKTKRSK